MQVTVSEIVMQFPARSPSEHLAVYVDNLAPGFVPRNLVHFRQAVLPELVITVLALALDRI